MSTAPPSSAADDAPTPAAASSEITELRVHGINKATDFSSLGTGRRARRSTHSDLLYPVVPPSHTLRLFNWSETNRRLTGPLWAAALPFTLANVAGHMGWHGGRARELHDPDVDPGGDRWVQWTVIAHGLLLSCTALIWLVVIAEVVPRHLPSGAELPLLWTLGTVGLCCAALVVPMWVRVRHRISAHGRRRFVALAAANSLAVLALGAWLLAARPAEGLVQLPPLWSSTDLLTATILAGHFLVLVLVGVLLARALWLAIVRPGGAAATIGNHAVGAALGTAGGAALAVAAGWGLLVGTGSALRIGLEWLLQSAAPLLPPGLLLEEPVARPSALLHPDGLQNDTLGLPNGVLVLNTLSDLVFVAVLLGLGALSYRADRRARLVPPDESGPGWYWRLLHHVVGRLPRLLPAALVSALVAWTLLIVGVGAWWESRADAGVAAGIGARWLALLTVAIALVAFVFALSMGRWQRVRGAVDVLADVVGFFPVEWHPLSGLSYRRPVLDELAALTDELDGPIVYSGHSQGSVIGLWFLRHEAVDPGRFALITSGSPIRSLYATLFPRFFDDQMLATTIGRVHAWINVWRPTDPIATELHAPATDGRRRIVNIRSIDPPSLDTEHPADEHFGRPLERARWHLDYWTDHRLRAAIGDVVEALRRPAG